MDRWSSMQQNIMPTVDETFVGFKIEMLFEYDNDDGTRYLDWCNGVVDSIINERTRCVTIKWNKDSLGPNDSDTSRKKYCRQSGILKKLQGGPGGNILNNKGYLYTQIKVY